MRARHLDLVVVAAIAVIGATVVLTSFGGGVLRVAVGLPLALMLPGYALTAALFPGASVGLPERVTLTLGVSLATLVVVGVALNATPQGLTPVSWSLVLAAVTLAAALIAVRRRKRGTMPLRFSLLSISPETFSAFGLAALLVAAALVIAHAGALAPQGAGFTQLWMLPGTASAANVRIGVTNKESSTLGYLVELESGSQVQSSWKIELAPGESWQTTVAINPSRPGAATAALLYRLDLPGHVYRQVNLAGAP